jgi:hypothetical protein
VRYRVHRTDGGDKLSAITYLLAVLAACANATTEPSEQEQPRQNAYGDAARCGNG